MARIALILGHGVAFPDGLENAKEMFLSTPYGSPSEKIIQGDYQGLNIILLYRHGKDKTIPAFQVNYKANMFVLKEMECEYIFATSLCGSLQEEIIPGEFVVFDQFIDLTKHRELTYTDKVDVKELNHAAFNKPFSDDVRNCFIEAAVVQGITIHTKGTVIAVDGPRQSTRAESNLFRSWKADVVNTTTAPEAILAHELNIPYGALSLCTYYDTWRTDIPPATHSEKLQILEENKEQMSLLLKVAISKL
jgi:5'-methylthioadenosine phosphorylase